MTFEMNESAMPFPSPHPAPQEPAEHDLNAPLDFDLKSTSHDRVRIALAERLDLLLEHALELLHIEIGRVFLIDSNTRELSVLAERRDGSAIAPSGLIFKMGQGAAGWIAQKDRPLAIADVHRDSHWLQVADDAKIASYLGVPLRIDTTTGRRVIGVVGVATRTPREFSLQETSFLIALAGQAAVAIENARFYEIEKQRAREFAALYEIANDLAAQHHLPTLLQTIADRAASLLAAPNAAIYLYDETRGDLALAVEKDIPQLSGTRLQFGEGLAGRVAQTQQPSIVDRYQTWEGRSPQYNDLPFTTSVAVPMLYDGDLIGVLAVHDVRETAPKFGEAAARLLALLAAQAASAVHNARLLSQTTRRAEQLAVLDAAAIRIQRQLDPAKIFQTTCDELRNLGRLAQVYLRAEDDTIEHIHTAMPQDLLREYLAAFGDREVHYSLPLALIAPIWQRLCAGETILEPGLLDRVVPGMPPESQPIGRWIERHVQNAPALLAPITRSSKTIGMLVVVGDHLDISDLTAVALFARHVSAALENASLLQETRERAGYQAALNDMITSAAEVGTNLDALLDVALQRALEALNLTQGAIWLAHSDGGMPRFVMRGLNQEMGASIARTAKTQQWDTLHAHVMTDWCTDNRPLAPVLAHSGIRASITVPLLSKGTRVGGFSVCSSSPRRWPEPQVTFMESVGRQLGAAIERARLTVETEGRANQFAALYETSRDLAIHWDLPTLLQTIITRAMTLLSADSGAMYLYNAATRDLETIAAHGPGFTLGSHFPVGPGMSGQVVRTWQPLIVDDYHEWQGRRPDYETTPFTAAVQVPVLYGGELIGVLMVAEVSDGRRKFGEADARLLSLFAAQAGSAVHNVRLFQEARRRALEQTAVSQVANALNASLNVGDTFPLIVQSLRTLVDCERISVCLLDSDGENVTFAELDQPRAELGKGTRLSIRATSAAQDIQQGRPHLTPDLGAELQAMGEQVLYQAGFRSRLNLPLVVGDRILGSLNLASRTVGAFVPDRVGPLQQIADALAIAIQNLYLYRAEQTHRGEMNALYKLARRLADLNDFDLILAIVLEHAVEIMPVTFAAAILQDGGDLVVRAVYPGALEPPAHVPERVFEMGRREPVAGLTLFQHSLGAPAPSTTCIVMRADEAGIGEPEKTFFMLDVAHTVCIVPLYIRTPLTGEGPAGAGRALGFLVLGETRPDVRDPFTPDQVRLAGSIGDQAAGALHRAELFERLENSYLETVLALANAVDAKDTYTADHAQGLAVKAIAIGRELGLSAREIEDLRFGAILHDIGKIGVSDSILKRRSELDERQWEEMRRHPAIGARILAPIPRLANAARIVHHHHERYDGHGYPDALAGEQIPLGARILAVVDAYSAMVDQRIYKSSVPHSEAMLELKRCAGSQFDRHLVEIFCRLFDPT